MKFTGLCLSAAIIFTSVNLSARGVEDMDAIMLEEMSVRANHKSKKPAEQEPVPLGVLVISDYGGKPALSADAIIGIIEKGNIEELKIKVNPKTINSKNKNGDTPLLFAARKANMPAVIDILVQSGADTEIKDKNGYTPLMLAVKRPLYPGIATSLIKNRANVNAVYAKEKNSVLMLALADSSVSPGIISVLADTGADVNFKNPDKNTPLLLALKNINNASIIDILISAGADIEQKDKNGLSPLMIAISRPSCPNMAIALISNKADLNAVSDGLMTSLMIALNNQSTKPEVIRAFIDNGADINAKNAKGQTALMFAAMNFDDEIIKLFKKAKADFSIKDNDGLIARDYAENNPQISKKILKKIK